MTPRMIIALCGRRRSGKDTVANYLVKTHGFQHFKISAPLKHATKSLFGFTDEQIETNAKDVVAPDWGITPREAMQFLGTDVLQYKLQELLPDVGRSFFMKHMMYRLSQTRANVVISDMRFLHEYNALHEAYPRALKTIEIIRYDIPLCELDAHASEQEFREIPISHTIHNVEDRRHLHEQVEKYIRPPSS